LSSCKTAAIKTKRKNKALDVKYFIDMISISPFGKSLIWSSIDVEKWPGIEVIATLDAQMG